MADITWERALIRTGFEFRKHGAEIHFLEKNRANLQYFRRIIEILDIQERLQGVSIFLPPFDLVNEDDYLHAFERAKRSHSYFEGFDEIELSALDTYVAGITRWTNAIGLMTTQSCDGHGRRPASLYFITSQEKRIFNLCLSALTNEKWKLVGTDEKGGRIRQPHSDLPLIEERRLLLDLAEQIHAKRDVLRVFATAGLEICKCSQVDDEALSSAKLL